MDIHYKIGDIVFDFKGSTWGNTKFIVVDFHGNKHTPLAWVNELDKPNTNAYKCNFCVKTMRLVDSQLRPMRNVNKIVLIKMMSRGIDEAKREFTIRMNSRYV